jgi:hypothetical protein
MQPRSNEVAGSDAKCVSQVLSGIGPVMSAPAARDIVIVIGANSEIAIGTPVAVTIECTVSVSAEAVALKAIANNADKKKLIFFMTHLFLG